MNAVTVMNAMELETAIESPVVLQKETVSDWREDSAAFVATFAVAVAAVVAFVQHLAVETVYHVAAAVVVVVLAAAVVVVVVAAAVAAVGESLAIGSVCFSAGQVACLRGRSRCPACLCWHH